MISDVVAYFFFFFAISSRWCVNACIVSNLIIEAIVAG